MCENCRPNSKRHKSYIPTPLGLADAIEQNQGLRYGMCLSMLRCWGTEQQVFFLFVTFCCDLLVCKSLWSVLEKGPWGAESYSLCGLGKLIGYFYQKCQTWLMRALYLDLQAAGRKRVVGTGLGFWNLTLSDTLSPTRPHLLILLILSKASTSWLLRIQKSEPMGPFLFKSLHFKSIGVHHAPFNFL